MNLKILIAQMNTLVGDVPGNARKVAEIAGRARDLHQAHAVVFPELVLTGYPPEDLLLRSELTQRVEQALDGLCREVSGVTLILGYPKRVGAALYNVAGVIRDGRIVAEYGKQELPNYGVFDEKRYFQAGSEPCVVELQGVRLGITV